MQSVDRNAYFLVANDVNAHQGEWLGSSTTTVHGKAALGFV